MEGTKMQCPKCQFENPEESKFCGGCGKKLDLTCPECGATNPTENKFCNKCGCNLKPVKEVFDQTTEPISPPVSPAKETISTETSSTNGERKHVTVLFSDLTGYTAMSEKLDPEEVKEITSQIFGDISKIVGKYDGFIEKYAGDAVMAIFGVPNSHEDDPIRAVKTAREIHELVDTMSPDIEKRTGQPISMHSGINTGLVVTGEVDLDRGTHGIAGDTINLASRLSNLAKPGEILIDTSSCRQVEGHFECEYLENTAVKGKADPIQVHKVLSQRDKPVTIHRLSGLRADLVGRKAELAELAEAVDNLHAGKGKIFSICGSAGTGKSRLVEEFKVTLDLENIQWIEGHAYAYSQNIPYFPLIDLFNRILLIEENDPPERVKEKVERGIENLVGKQEEIVPYVGGLYSLSYQEIQHVSPEFWKSHLQSAVKIVLSALAKRAPTIYFLEDLHWADPSFVELLRKACLEIREPAIVLCVYRPNFTLFTGNQLSGVGEYYHEIQLQDLSRTEAQDMLESLLKTSNIPSDLKRLAQSKTEGNPFYLEELVNSLIESETLIRDNGHWIITKSVSEADISSTIHGLISGRLDRLEIETKRILQEASVIGRAFLYEILKRITELKVGIDHRLRTLERLDLIRTRALQPDLEYIFKHPLTQEVVYNGVLKKERRDIHEQIALVMEGIFQDRLPEFYETLAFHFKHGRSVLKAVDYLMKSGEKSAKRYAIEESHQYYKEAFNLLTDNSDKSYESNKLLIDLLIKWAYVFYYRGDFAVLINIFNDHEDLAKSLDDKAKYGMFNAWLGFACWMSGDCNVSYPYLRKALDLGEETRNQELIGYACTWLTWNAAELGLFEEACRSGERAYEISKLFKSDHYLVLKPLAGMAFACVFTGEGKKAIELGQIVLDYGRKNSDIRSMAAGHASMGLGYMACGDLLSAEECLREAIQVAVDPVYSIYAKTFLGPVQILLGKFKEAEDTLREPVHFGKEYGFGSCGIYAYAFQGLLSIIQGKMSAGIAKLEEALNQVKKNGRRCVSANLEHVLGYVYLQIVKGDGPKSFSFLAKNIGFIIKDVPVAAKKAETHFKRAIEIAKEIGANGVLAETYLELGSLYKVKRKTEQARDCLSKAIKIFEQNEAEFFIKQAKQALESLQ
jgi:class 3 adenylate cyclase/tetratricopeptide (TPR) repeat protein